MTELQRRREAEGSQDSEETRAARAEDARRFSLGLLILIIFPPAFLAWVIWDAVTSVQKGLEEAERDSIDSGPGARPPYSNETPEREER